MPGSEESGSGFVYMVKIGSVRSSSVRETETLESLCPGEKTRASMRVMGPVGSCVSCNPIACCEGDEVGVVLSACVDLSRPTPDVNKGCFACMLKEESMFHSEDVCDDVLSDSLFTLCTACAEGEGAVVRFTIAMGVYSDMNYYANNV